MKGALHIKVREDGVFTEAMKYVVNKRGGEGEMEYISTDHRSHWPFICLKVFCVKIVNLNDIRNCHFHRSSFKDVLGNTISFMVNIQKELKMGSTYCFCP